MDIGFVGCMAVSGVKYVLLLVDWATHNKFEYSLHNLTKDMSLALLQFLSDIKTFCIITDFDSKFIWRKVKTILRTHKTQIVADPTGRQNQKGLVERV